MCHLVPSRRCLYASLAVVIACLADPVAVRASQHHGLQFGPVCDEVLFVGDLLSCEVLVFHNDDFGDTLAITDAYLVIDPWGVAERIPAGGNLPVVAVTGNTTAAVGGPLPILIGPADSMLSGLPGAPDAGLVTLGSNTYVIPPDAVDPLPISAVLGWLDLCDAVPGPGCGSLPHLTQFNVAVDLGHASVLVSAAADPPILCPQAPDAEVEFSFAIHNDGDVALENVVVTDDLCEPLAGPFGDIDGDSILDIAEEFIDLNGSGAVWEPGEPIIDDNGNGVLDDAETWTYTCTTLVSEFATNAAVVTAAVEGRPDVVVEGAASVSVALCATDLNCTGDTGFGDLLALLTAWGPCSSGFCPEDVDGSGRIDLADVMLVITGWGSCVR